MRSARNTGHAPTDQQLKLKARHELTDQMFQDMLEMLARITPAERTSLQDPDFITEDEADMIFINREPDEPGVPLDEILAELGYTPRNRRSA